MKIAGVYSFNDGENVVAKKHPGLLAEVNAVINAIDASKCKSKESEEKTMPGRLLFSPRALNDCFKIEFSKFRDWKSVRVPCDYPSKFYRGGYTSRATGRNAFREMDFVKDELGIEVQFGKYAFMVYNVCAKMTIFKNLGHIKTGIEIVPVKAFADEMSTGV